MEHRVTIANKSRGHDGIVVLDEVRELLELSVVPVPANDRTRTLSAKSNDRQAMSLEALRQRQAELGLAGALNPLDEHRHRIPTQAELYHREETLHADGVIEAGARVRNRRGRDLDDAITRMRDATRAQMTTILAGTAHPPRDDLRRRATEATAEYELERAMTFNPRA